MIGFYTYIHDIVVEKKQGAAKKKAAKKSSRKESTETCCAVDAPAVGECDMLNGYDGLVSESMEESRKRKKSRGKSQLSHL